MLNWKLDFIIAYKTQNLKFVLWFAYINLLHVLRTITWEQDFAQPNTLAVPHIKIAQNYNTSFVYIICPSFKFLGS